MALTKINRNPTRSQLRQFAGIWFPAFFLLLGFIIGRKTGHWPVVYGSWVILGAISLAGIALPSSIRPVWNGLMLVTYPIGWVISHVILGAIYYLLVTPVGLVLRLLGKDPLERGFDPAMPTYWKSRESHERKLDDYFRQF